ncbi:hypothetical protein AB0D78_37990 [Streptomyces avermitilis]|uniref:hypothetical protein n=1 Tax=Streptomyces avermitilis TaxID=33903 RepID=UPI0033E56BDC
MCRGRRRTWRLRLRLRLRAGPWRGSRGAAGLALKRTREATADDVLEIGLYEFGVVIEPQAALTARRVTEHEQDR